ncbi:MAG: tol-pal system protein YbgF [Xanthomonadales bacterium]|nr:tol-pal system protein YbgF [Xanthomonadales bacterium]
MMRKLVVSTAALAAAVAFPAFAQSGRLSLADRVAQLEAAQNQAASSGNQTVELLNRITQLQAEIQSLRGLVEQQSYEIETLKKRNRDQYLDLDSRLARLEGGSPAAPASAASDGGLPADSLPANAEPLSDVPATPRTVMEDPEVRAPVDGQTQTAGLGGGELAADPQTIADPVGEKAMYESAFDALKEGRYAEAARRFQSFLTSYPNGEFAPNAHYWLGESYYVTQNYQIALDAFRQLLSEFPNSSKAPDALLKVGYCHYELRQWGEAEATLNQVVERYPETTVSRLAQGRLRALRLENRQ